MKPPYRETSLSSYYDLFVFIAFKYVIMTIAIVLLSQCIYNKAIISYLPPYTTLFTAYLPIVFLFYYNILYDNVKSYFVTNAGYNVLDLIVGK